jgi:[ribosomal protein S18]-alanine N-acetyltransferase
MNLFQRQKQPKLLIRWVIGRDFPEILGIENESFEFPWCEQDFRRLLRRRNYVGVVAETNDHIAGYMLYEHNKGCIDLLNLAVDPKFRRACVGTELIAKLIAKLSHSRHPVLAVSVRDSNLSAHLFFRSLGFRCVQVRHHYYQNTADDAYDFVYDIRRQEPECAGVGANRVSPLYTQNA